MITTKEELDGIYSKPPSEPLIAEIDFKAIGGRFYTCAKHGWSALGNPCPDCMNGDAPRRCVKHGWNHLTKGCPVCEAGR